MTLFDAVILGTVQGLTEFLPISSSGHLVIGQHLLNFEEPNLAFDIVLHLGTLMAVFIYFWRDIMNILYSFGRRGETAWRNVGLLVLLGTVPTGLIGLTFKTQFENLFASVRVVAVMLVITGILLFLADRIRRTDRPLFKMRSWDALLIGTVQAFAILPGISRSGSTIATGLFLKMEPDGAARFSFLLSIPAILGAVVLEGSAIMGHTVNGSGPAFFAGFITSAVSGLLAIILFMRILKWKKLSFFSIYCWLVAAVTFIFLT